MTRVTVHEAKTHLSRLLEEVEKGGEVVISRRDKPIARLVPIEPRPDLKPPRRPGRFAGQFALGPAFFESMPDEELVSWEGRGE